MQNQQTAMDHIKNHQKYPATKAQLLAECDNLSEFSAEDKQFFADHLTADNYNSADEVIKDMGW